MNSSVSIVPSLFYKDPEKALDFLEQAFGFELQFSVTDDQGNVVHAELGHGNGRVMVGPCGWAKWPHSPEDLDGANTQGIHLAVEDVDAHCERARGAGAQIVAEPEDQFYGDRTYRALDCEGHFWTFGQSVRDVSIEEMERVSGMKITGEPV